MKLAFSMSLLILAFAAPSAFADDPLKVAPDMYHLLFENNEIRVMKVDFKPGQKIAKHSHPDHHVIVSKPGTLRIWKEDGSSSDVALKKDEVLWIPAETHWAENIGKTEIQLLVNERKSTNHAPMG